jgi:putative colanic acid biosynthesis glycosyltransferase WcaI
MRILLLIVQFPPDVNSTGLLMEQIAQGLVDRGHHVSVITTVPHYENFRVWDEYRGKLFSRAAYGRLQVLRTWVYANGSKNQMLRRLLSYLSFNALATLAGVTSRDAYDVILCTNGSFFSGLSATLIGWVKRAPFIYNVQDLYPETPVQAGQLRNKYAIAMLERLERAMYHTAARVSVITPAFRENIVSKGLREDKVAIIPNFVDTDFIRPLPKDNAFARRHNLENKFIVAHAGNIGFVYDLETLVGAAALLKDMRDVLILIVGDGVMRQRLVDKTKQLGLENVRFLPFQPRAALPEMRAASDVQLALYRQGSARYSMPSKVYEIMASGRPALASAEPRTDLWNLIQETDCGIVVEPGDAQKLAGAIRCLYHDQRLRTAMGERGRRYATACYSLEAVLNQYETLLQRTAMVRPLPERSGEVRAPGTASRKAAREAARR